MLFFISSITFIKPLVVIPGLFGNQLQVSLNYSSLWYCPKSKSNFSLTATPHYFFPPLRNCIVEWMKLEFNSTSFFDPNYKTVSAFDFGGSSSVECQYSNFLCYDVFRSFVKYFEFRSYSVSKNLFFAPYDWRFGYIGSQNFYPQLKKLIERAYQLNNKKVVLIGFSCGAVLSQVLLNIFVDQDWIDKYIDHSILVAPAIGGILDALGAHLGPQYCIASKIITTGFKDFISNFPVFYQGLPHFGAFGNHTVLIDEKGIHHNCDSAKKYLFRKIPDFKAKDHAAKPFSPSIIYDFSRKNIKVLYNSAVKTVIGINLSAGDESKFIYGNGDGTVSDFFAKKYCKILECRDVKDPTITHRKLVVKKAALDALYEMI